MSAGILSVVGSTPLVQLERAYPALPFALYAKLEGLNPGGSTKDRPARSILEAAMQEGRIGPGTVVIESSSGNMGVGLAQACCCYGLRLICVVDIKTTEANVRILRAYGAEIDIVTEPDPATGEFLPARLQRVEQLLQKHKGSFWPNQYANLNNPAAHYATTMHEIADALGGRVDYVLCATSTCGTVRGCAEYVRDHQLKTRVVAVDAQGSLIFSDQKGKRLLPGMGAGIRPPLCEPRLIDEVVLVSDLECVVGCRRLVVREGILAGASSGGLLAAVGRLRGTIPEGSVCAVILPDRGERYLDTVYSDEWVSRCFGDVAHLWQQDAEALSTVHAELVTAGIEQSAP